MRAARNNSRVQESKAKALGARAAYVNEALVHHMIDPTRLTVEYFARRAFYQAVCDSFTSIRSGEAPSRKAVRAPTGISKGPGGRWSAFARDVRARAAAAYEEGWAFHQREAMEDPRLLQWIHRENFWDVDIRTEARAREPAAE